MTVAVLLRFWWVGAIGGLVLALAFTSGQLGQTRAALAVQVAETKAANDRANANAAARVREAAAALASYDGLKQTCDAGLKLAVTRGRTIERIVSAPAPASGSRGIVDAGQLRGVVGQDAPAAHRRP
jgi:hypothetical protein